MLSTYLNEIRASSQRQTDWFRSVRNSSIDRLEKYGFPSKRQEAWKNTPLTSFLERHIPKSSQGSVDQKYAGTWWDKSSIVFRDGFLVKNELKRPGIRLKFMKDVLSDTSVEGVRDAFNLEPRNVHPFFDLNTALIHDGVFLEVDDKVEVQDPVFILFESSGISSAKYYRNAYVLGKGSSVRIVEVYVGDNGLDPSFTNAVTQKILRDGSRLDHIKIQDEHKQTNHMGISLARLTRDSSLHSYSFSFGGGFVRNDIEVHLEDNGSECVLDGLYVGSSGQTVDHHTTVNHAAPHTTSSETYRGILGGDSRGVFEGKVVVAQEAQKIQAYQLNQNLILSDEARIHTAPQLEILANDVKCTHGATVGRLDENQIFYLRSRGISTSEAKRMLLHAYANEIISRTKNEWLEEDLHQRVLRSVL